MQHKARNSNFTQVGLLGQKRADIIKFEIYVHNSQRSYELVEISFFCHKREDNNILRKYSHCFT